MKLNLTGTHLILILVIAFIIVFYVSYSSKQQKTILEGLTNKDQQEKMMVNIEKGITDTTKTIKTMRDRYDELFDFSRLKSTYQTMLTSALELTEMQNMMAITQHFNNLENASEKQTTDFITSIDQTDKTRKAILEAQEYMTSVKGTGIASNLGNLF